MLQRREFILAFLVLGALALLSGMLVWRQFQQAEQVEAGALSKWHALERQLRERSQLLSSMGLTTLHSRQSENVTRRVQHSLQDTGIAPQRLQGVRPRESRPMMDGAAVRQVVVIKLEALSPSEIGAWLAGWRKADNPWRIIGMSWRHHSGGTGNGFDLQVSCAAVLMH